MPDFVYWRKKNHNHKKSQKKKTMFQWLCSETHPGFFYILFPLYSSAILIPYSQQPSPLSFSALSFSMITALSLSQKSQPFIFCFQWKWSLSLAVNIQSCSLSLTLNDHTFCLSLIEQWSQPFLFSCSQWLQATSSPQLSLIAFPKDYISLSLSRILSFLSCITVFCFATSLNDCLICNLTSTVLPLFILTLITHPNTLSIHHSLFLHSSQLAFLLIPTPFPIIQMYTAPEDPIIPCIYMLTSYNSYYPEVYQKHHVCHNQLID